MLGGHKTPQYKALQRQQMAARDQANGCDDVVAHARQWTCLACVFNACLEYRSLVRYCAPESSSAQDIAIDVRRYRRPPFPTPIVCWVSKLLLGSSEIAEIL